MLEEIAEENSFNFNHHQVPLGKDWKCSLGFIGDLGSDISKQDTRLRQEVALVSNSILETTFMIQDLLKPEFTKKKENQALKQKILESEIEYNKLTYRQKWEKRFDEIFNQSLQVLKHIFSIWTPDSVPRISWDLMGMLFIVIQLLLIPLVLSFDIPYSLGYNVFTSILDYYFLIDILVNLNTGFYIKGQFINSHRISIMRYMRLWFWIDLVASFPYDLVVSSFNVQNQHQNVMLLKFIRFLKFIKVLRLLRALKLKQIIRNIEDSLDLGNTLIGLIGLMKLSILILCCAHWMACMFHLVSVAQDNPQEGWIYQYHVENEEWDVIYLSALYFSVTTMITIGYGDIHPYSPPEMFFQIFAMILASGVFGYVMNSIMAIFDNDSPETKILNSQLDFINKYIRQKALPIELQGRIRNYIEWFSDSYSISLGQQNTLQSISHNLKNELQSIISAKILKRIHSLTPHFSVDLLCRIALILDEKVYDPDQMIIVDLESNEPFEERYMYFVQQGEVSIEFRDYSQDQSIQILEKYSTFGEIGFYANVPRTAYVKSVSFTNIILLQRQKFLQIAQLHQSDFQKFHKLKQQIEFSGNIKPIHLKCYACQKTKHLIQNCPLLHYVFKKKNALKKITQEFQLVNHKVKNMRLRRKKQHWTSYLLKTYLQRKKFQLRFLGMTLNIPQHHLYLEQEEESTPIKESTQIVDRVYEYLYYCPDFNISQVAATINNKAQIMLHRMIREVKGTLRVAVKRTTKNSSQWGDGRKRLLHLKQMKEKKQIPHHKDRNNFFLDFSFDSGFDFSHHKEKTNNNILDTQPVKTSTEAYELQECETLRSHSNEQEVHSRLTQAFDRYNEDILLKLAHHGKKPLRLYSLKKYT